MHHSARGVRCLGRVVYRTWCVPRTPLHAWPLHSPSLNIILRCLAPVRPGHLAPSPPIKGLDAVATTKHKTLGPLPTNPSPKCRRPALTNRQGVSGAPPHHRSVTTQGTRELKLWASVIPGKTHEQDKSSHRESKRRKKRGFHPMWDPPYHFNSVVLTLTPDNALKVQFTSLEVWALMLKASHSLPASWCQVCGSSLKCSGHHKAGQWEVEPGKPGHLKSKVFTWPSQVPLKSSPGQAWFHW